MPPTIDTAEMKRMQQDAARRALEMQNRSKRNPPDPAPPQNQVSDAHPSAEVPSNPPVSTLEKNPIHNIFSLLFQDSERSLLLVLLLLLISEKADTELIFLLLFLLL